MTTRRSELFRYSGWSWTAGELHCRYQLDDLDFVETYRFPDAPAELTAEQEQAARLVFLLAGISYYKAGAPPVIDLGDHAITENEQDFLRSYYLNGLGEFAYKNGLLGELQQLSIVGPTQTAHADNGHGGAEPTSARFSGLGRDLAQSRPLIPFGGGIDSIVVVEQARAVQPDLELFVVNRRGARFAAIEQAAAVAALPVRHIERELDPKILRSGELGFLNGHIPVTGVISMLATLTALLAGRDAVVMSNEWSASSGTIVHDGIPVNHQWSKSLQFETSLRGVLSEVLPGFSYFSALRPWTELWVAQRFAELEKYHLAFRSCNRAFHLDPARRLDHWCGECDKCCFIDLILSPYLTKERLEQIFDGREPLANSALRPKFIALLGDPETAKPFECVGDEDECRVATVVAAERPDRTNDDMLQALAAEIRRGVPLPPTDSLLHPMSASFVAPDLLAHNRSHAAIDPS